MALFKKPKKNIRARNIEKDDEEFGNGENAINNTEENKTSLTNIKLLKKKDREKDIQRSKQTTLLSFGDEEGKNSIFLFVVYLHLILQLNYLFKKMLY